MSVQRGGEQVFSAGQRRVAREEVAVAGLGTAFVRRI